MGLFKFERRWTRELFNAIIPGGLHPDIPEGAGDLGADQCLEDFYARSKGMGAIGFRGGLWLTWFLPPLILGVWRTFGRLSPDEQQQYIWGLYRHRWYLVRQLAFLMKLVASTGYLRNARVREAFGVYTRTAAELPPPQLKLVLPPRKKEANEPA